MVKIYVLYITYEGTVFIITQLEKLGIAIKDARAHNNMTQKDLANIIHITSRHLAEIENGRQKPSYDLLCSLVHKLAIPVDDIFYPNIVHSRNELEEVVTMLHFCNDQELTVVSAALHAIMKYK
jgi:DNA-binding XRE family transcriptional regulator